MITYITEAIFFVWLICLSWVIFKMRSHYLRLTTRTGKQRIDEILEEFLKTDKNITYHFNQLRQQVDKLTKESEVHLQKIGLVRFNPFERVAGEQSFVLALLDKKNSGILVNFIYTKDGLRTYIKRVIEGKGDKYDLSEEEKRAIIKST